MGDLTTTERKQHKRDVALVTKNMGAFVETGQALARIRDGRTYRGTHETFEAFCKETWEFTKSYANNLIGSASVMDALNDNHGCQTHPILPTNERQTRPLTTIDLELVGEVWQTAVDEAPQDEDGNPVITAKHVKAVVDRMRPPKPTPDLPDDKYKVLYADPPWSYSDKCAEGAVQAGGCERHYSTLTIAELCALPVKEMALDDSVLFLWVTSPLLEECFPVIRAWGFSYKAAFIWDKVRHNMGHYNSVRHELLLICTRGSCVPQSKELIDSVVELKRSPKHSEKPERFREIIDQLYPEGPRIELFARTAAEGWERWGNEAQ